MTTHDDSKLADALRAYARTRDKRAPHPSVAPRASGAGIPTDDGIDQLAELTKGFSLKCDVEEPVSEPADVREAKALALAKRPAMTDVDVQKGDRDKATDWINCDASKS